MGYFQDGFFTGFLCSVKETGRRLKNGAKELVEDFISGFNGHGWKLWKRGDSWRLELDELMVRKSFQVFELIINQITAIKGSQAITQGHAKIKDVAIIQEADSYQETIIETYPEDFLDAKWSITPPEENNPITWNTHSIKQPSDESGAISFVVDITAANVLGFDFEITDFGGAGAIAMMTYENGELKSTYIRENGRYSFPVQEVVASENPIEVGIIFLASTSGTLSILSSTSEIVETIVKVPSYRIQIDDEYNSISEYDLVRCQKGNKFYYVQVGSVFQYYINIPLTEFESNEEGVVLNPPQPGDELVQFGNVSKQDKYKSRHSAIYLHVDEEEPAIDLMTDIYSKDWSIGNIIKTRLGGNLPGTNGDRGFYCVNGKLLFVDEYGNTVSVINPDGSASFAKGKVSWKKDGSPYFEGNIISGKKEGKRIEILSENGDIIIYSDENNPVITLSGKEYLKEYLWGQSELSVKISWIPYTYDSSKTTTRKLLMMISNEFTISSDNIYITYFDIVNYSSFHEDNSFKYSIFLKSIDPNISRIVLSAEEKIGISQSTNITTPYTFNIPKGTWIMYIELEVVATVNEYPVWVKFETISFESTINKYLANMFSNGFILGNSSINNFTAINNYDSSPILGMPDHYMTYNLTNPYAGIKIDKNAVYVQSFNNIYGLVDSVIMKGVFDPYGSLMVRNYFSFDMQTPKISMDKDSTGAYMVGHFIFEYPKSWLDIMSRRTPYIFLQSFNVDDVTKRYPVVLNVYYLSNTMFKVNCYSARNRTYENTKFYIEIKI